MILLKLALSGMVDCDIVYSERTGNAFALHSVGRFDFIENTPCFVIYLIAFVAVACYSLRHLGHIEENAEKFGRW